MQPMPQQGMQTNIMPNGMPQSFPVQGGESPCAKKARESAEKIAALEAEVVETKKDK